MTTRRNQQRIEPALNSNRSDTAPDRPSLLKRIAPVMGFASLLLILGGVQQAYSSQGRAVERNDARVQQHALELAVLKEKLDTSGHGLAHDIGPPNLPRSIDSSGVAPAASPATAGNRLGAISHPADSFQTSSDQVRVNGSVDANLTDALFVFVCPELSSKCWPQSDDEMKGLPAVREGNDWHEIVNLGGPAQSYGIDLYAASASATKALGGYLRSAAVNRDRSGLLPKELPAGLTLLHHITIAKRP